MMTTDYSAGRCLRFLTAYLLALGAVPVGDTAGDENLGDDRDKAIELVHEAVQADLDGRLEERDSAIARAIAAAPNCPLARWHNGQVLCGDQWIDLNTLQAENKSQGWIDRYRQLRDEHANSLQGHLMLARFCHRHGLKDREKLHWHAVLMAAPGNKDAIRSLGVRPYRGALLTNAQIQWLEETENRWNAAKEKWQHELLRIQKAILHGTSEERETAIERLAAMDDPDVLPFAEEALAGETDELLLQLIALAGRIEGQTSTNLLTRYAVSADSDDVREAAIRHLKRRDWFTFVPALMGAMVTPVEVSFSATPVADGMFASISFRREGPLVGYERELKISNSLASRGSSFRRPSGGTPNRDRVAAAAVRQGVRAYQQTIAENRRVQFWNNRIDLVLSDVTGQETDGRPQSWWQWWQEYNDLYIPEEKPIYRTEDEIVIRDRVTTCECFLPGTPVWTETGPEPIERIAVGDRVLAQDADTGELAYKLVLQTTVRPDAGTVRVGIDDEEIYATNGHPFWVAGEGWKMARRLEPGMRLHTATGSREITHVEEGPTWQAHNLLVADFPCFFVGNAKILVHDNSVRQPTASVVPGVTAEQAGIVVPHSPNTP